MGRAPIDGYYLGDIRLVDQLTLTVNGQVGEHIATEVEGADRLRFVLLFRGLDDDETADPDVRGEHAIHVRSDGVEHSLRLVSRRDVDLPLDIVLSLGADHSELFAVKAGIEDPQAAVTIEIDGRSATWRGRTAWAEITCPKAEVTAGDGLVTARWHVSVPEVGEAVVHWTISAHDPLAVVEAPATPPPWTTPTLDGVEPDLARWVRTALADLDALRLVRIGDDSEFLAAGAPWFFTLFGRDALWAARFMLPLGTSLAGSTLRTLAALQGRAVVRETAEQPGKIPHELRRAVLQIPGSSVALPPLYYGTIDATALWILLLVDAASAGLPAAEVDALLPALRKALAWLRDYGDADGDGLLEYVDETGHGLANQGWKDSGDSVQWRDGHLADAPLALCEVQGYAYAAAHAGARLLESAVPGEGEKWRIWAERLRIRFHESFWVKDSKGAYPAVALDARKRPVDSLASNIGHLLGTGLLDREQAALVASRVVSPELCSGYGLRTLSTMDAGYWPLSYHGGSVWTHDTAIVIDGLVREGYVDEARTLATGLLRAAAGFGGRVPELYSGDPASSGSIPVPYPAACRPQAWSAAAAITVLGVLG
jgi:glycogen debranching enzyme